MIQYIYFPVTGGHYNRVSEHIAINTVNRMYLRPMTIDKLLLLMVPMSSLTHGSPRQHIWTFACGGGEDRPTLDEACPCDAR